MGWFGLGRPRTKFGKWMEDEGITQAELAQKSGVSQSVISELAHDAKAKPSWRTKKRLRDTLEEYGAEDMWED
ncbi:helix-turn-helix domain-containing protein [Alicyclobacillus sp. ALC3]|uniref:helix-turn-helix domain-containing protein n=1 Tax=Alicyclobacillus sp. ALC3 TaxID=2796143 RepID=UPI00237A0385|nr:helix-turn-helix transcriptional regulator [Alicyclobacillus sp. ALC3]WDL97784.1 helix-turn-helix transcriptional regulator [Alicyclobacillus sp. ALC3]